MSTTHDLEKEVAELRDQLKALKAEQCDMFIEQTEGLVLDQAEKFKQEFKDLHDLCAEQQRRIAALEDVNQDRTWEKREKRLKRKRDPFGDRDRRDAQKYRAIKRLANFEDPSSSY